MTLWATGGVLVGLLLVVLMVGVGALDGDEPDPGPRPPAEPEGEEAVAELLAAWERSGTATFRGRSRPRPRAAPDGRSFAQPVIVVQRPPDHLTISGGQVDGFLDGRSAVCSRPPGG